MSHTTDKIFPFSSDLMSSALPSAPFRYGILPSLGEVEERVPRRHLRELTTSAGLRAKLAVHEQRARAAAGKDATGAAADKTQDIHRSAVALPDSRLLTSSATINIAYAPAPAAASAQESLRAEQSFTGKAMIDALSMYDEDTTDGLNAADFWFCLKEEGISIHSHEKKYILKYYLKDDGSIEFKRFVNDLAKITKLDAGQLVLAYHKRADKWLLARVLRAHASSGEEEFDIEYAETDSAGRLRRPKRQRRRAVYEEDEEDDGDDAYAGEQYEEEEEDAQASAKGELPKSTPRRCCG